MRREVEEVEKVRKIGVNRIGVYRRRRVRRRRRLRDRQRL